jgi:hypothetical protein
LKDFFQDALAQSSGLRKALGSAFFELVADAKAGFDLNKKAEIHTRFFSCEKQLMKL